MESKKIEIGNFSFELPDNVAAGNSRPDIQPDAVKAEKSDEPEQLDEPRYIFRPNDPIQHHFDQVRAAENIGSTQKPWVRKTWFIVFVLLPFVFGESALAIMAVKTPPAGWKIFVAMNVLFLPIWYVYYLIWRKKNGK